MGISSWLYTGLSRERFTILILASSSQDACGRRGEAGETPAEGRGHSQCTGQFHPKYLTLMSGS